MGEGQLREGWKMSGSPPPTLHPQTVRHRHPSIRVTSQGRLHSKPTSEWGKLTLHSVVPAGGPQSPGMDGREESDRRKGAWPRSQRQSDMSPAMHHLLCSIRPLAITMKKKSLLDKRPVLAPEFPPANQHFLSSHGPPPQGASYCFPVAYVIPWRLSGSPLTHNPAHASP